jgi:DNA-binding MarR family transcriptional regulator
VNGVNDGPPHVVALMDRAWRRVRVDLDAIAREVAPDLRPSHVRILCTTPVAGMRMRDLAARLGITAQSLGEFVEVLADAGHLEVVVDPADRRARLVRPTQAGAATAATINAGIVRLEDGWRQQYGAARWNLLRSFLASFGPGGSGPGGEEPHGRIDQLGHVGEPTTSGPSRDTR